MNKFKKVGLSALAGSLAAFAANAGELAVSGSAEVTYHNDSGSGDTTGNPFGLQKKVKFSGSGELDNGYSFTFMTHQLQSAAGWTSAHLTLDMGDMGTIGFDQGSGLGHVGGIDDVTPTAGEEVWHGLGTSTYAYYGPGTTGSTSAWNYALPTIVDGLAVNVNYVNQTGGGKTNADGNSGATTSLKGSGTDVIFSYSGDMVPGLTIGGGIGDVDSTTTATGSYEDNVWYVKYAMGPITVGYSEFESRYTSTGTANGHDGNVWGVSFAVNDNLSVSYGESEVSFLTSGYSGNAINGSGTQVEQTTEGVNISYSMGGMTIRGTQTEGANMDGTTGSSDELTEVSVSLAF
jgi:outer membrane protein OmpU